jgi:hypothetical protein
MESFIIHTICGYAVYINQTDKQTNKQDASMQLRVTHPPRTTGKERRQSRTNTYDVDERTPREEI